MDTNTFAAYDKIVWQVAYGIFHKVPNIISHYTFGEVDDAHQQGWVCLLKDKKVSNFDYVDVAKHGGLIYTAIYRDLLDHIRSVCGRDDKKDKRGRLPHKTRAILGSINMESYPMDSDAEPDGQTGELTNETKAIISAYDIGHQNDTTMFEFALSKEIAEFMNKKLTVRDNYIARLMFVEGYSQKEVSKKFGMTESRVSQIVKKITETVQRKYA